MRVGRSASHPILNRLVLLVFLLNILKGILPRGLYSTSCDTYIAFWCRICVKVKLSGPTVVGHCSLCEEVVGHCSLCEEVCTPATVCIGLFNLLEFCRLGRKKKRLKRPMQTVAGVHTSSQRLQCPTTVDRQIHI